MTSFLGAVYTPSAIADLLTHWAIQKSSDTVLDLGIGEGVFTFSAYQKLLDYGAISLNASSQIYGAEIDKETFQRFSELCSQKSIKFPNVVCNNFFQSDFPQVDAIVGNPPYVRRQGFPPNEIANIRNEVLSANKTLTSKDLTQLTDLYVYFLLKSFTHLVPGGRLSVIVADSWLNARYGRVLKNYLKENFEVERMISFDRPIFSGAQVKPSLIFAIKKDFPSKNKKIAFTRVMNGLVPEAVAGIFQVPEPSIQDVWTSHVPSFELEVNQPWGIHFKISHINKLLAQSDCFIPLGEIARTQIGVQTLAKDFFTFTPEQIQKAGIEPKFLKPLAHSISQFQKPVIDKDLPPNLYVLFCSEAKEELVGTKILEHIVKGEAEELVVRGQQEVVIGHQNKERIKRAGRQYWYDLKTDILRRGCAPILLPRLIYRRYLVLWNKAQYVPGGAMIELCPKESLWFFNLSEEEKIHLFLAILNSTLMEVIIRGYAQMYGGGSYNIGLSQIKLLPFPDITRITANEQNQLISAYKTFIETENRVQIDRVVSKVFSINEDLFESTAVDLRLMATTIKKKVV